MTRNRAFSAIRVGHGKKNERFPGRISCVAASPSLDLASQVCFRLICSLVGLGRFDYSLLIGGR